MGNEQFARVVLETKEVLSKDTFTYVIPREFTDKVLPGVRVEVPFGNRKTSGYVVERVSETTVKARAINNVLDGPEILADHHLALAQYISRRYVAPLGEVVKAMLPVPVRPKSSTKSRTSGLPSSKAVMLGRDKSVEVSEAFTLTSPQERAVNLLTAAIKSRVGKSFLLHGVTGSGKTEVYLAAIATALEQGFQAIVLVPEISLTSQMVKRLAQRFPGRLAILHSSLTGKERAEEWQRIYSGEADIVVGSRSAVFAPVKKLGLIVIDEEDATSYKQDRIPRYHAVDVALELARLTNAVAILGSATPRVEMFYRAHVEDLELVTLSERIGGRPLPAIEIVDLREELKAGNRSPLSQQLEQSLIECHQQGGQSLLFLNRRGTATVVLCCNCGESLQCSHCSVSMVYHHSRKICDCHYCGASCSLPTKCNKCGSSSIRQLGLGTERLEVEMKERFPQLRVLRMDKDTVAKRDSHYAIYEAFHQGKADCLIGTQMIAKGWDFEGVQVVGIINADTGLHFPDYRSSELTFSLLTQVAGRTGRGDQPAKVVLQTFNPAHYAIRYAQSHDYMGFAREEIRIRKALSFPPYARLATCTYHHLDDAIAQSKVVKVATALKTKFTDDSQIDILGPTPAFINRVRGQHRWQFMVRGQDIEKTFGDLPKERGWSIDIDPVL